MTSEDAVEFEIKMNPKRLKGHSYTPTKKDPISSLPSIVNGGGVRADGRKVEEFRDPFFQTGSVTAATGSAFAEFGNTKVLVAVYGPRESVKAQAFSDVGRLNCDVQVAAFATPTRGKYGTGTEEKEYSAMLHKALEGAVLLHTFPKTTVDVFALILQSGGSDLAAIISCASLALAHAGIAMWDLVTAACVVRIGRHLIADPSDSEQALEEGSVIIATMAGRKEVTQIALSGEWSQRQAGEAIELCMEACLGLSEVGRACLKDGLL